ncbi:hypothetical protein FB446DRAFT_751956 [Lentinula raphanica]|nr:hypothetical protein C8R42DRAFT_416022 [Lentinula raphanica]KAJ3768358.1 hypothetical protein FB446DRAFT_751956 [Lentinula raphanica]
MNTLQASALDKNYGAESSFFDKFRDKIPGLGLGSESLAPSDDIPTARAGIGEGSATTPRAAPFRQNSNASEASTSSSSALTLNLSYSTSNASSKVKGPRRRTRKSSSNLPGVDEDGDTSGSEYGLAYADSTDYEDDDERDGSRFSVRSGASKMTARGSRDAITPKPGPRTDSLINSRPRAVSGSLYSDDEDDDNDLRNRLQSQSSPPANTNLSRAKSNASMSSVSSASSSSSAAAIAKALGLSRASMVSEGRRVMGGPGGPGIARTPSGSRIIGAAQRNRSATLDSAKSYRSDGAGRARSGTEGSVRAGGSMARSNKGDLEEAMKGLMSDTSSPLQPVRIGLRDDGPLTTVVPPLFDSPPSTRGSKMAHRSNTVGVTTPYTSAADAAKMLPKLPARSKTERGSKALHASTQQHYASPSVASSNDGTGKKKVRVCVRCSKRIEDGRWISIESPGVEDVHSGSSGEKGEKKGKSVLCESCWKNMYLPKCRRCNRPIEKQAVSSSDGQLKGKYHKDCFNCFTCNKPFPDKVFYVYDGRPLCKYHYHEANESLCAAATCGQPIEGPCAVSHTGDKYHPEHLTCEWDGYPKCEVRLNGEYWELEGRMLCERHAKGDIGRSSESGRDGGRRIEGEEGRARKRMTRFIDLGALGDLR